MSEREERTFTRQVRFIGRCTDCAQHVSTLVTRTTTSTTTWRLGRMRTDRRSVDRLPDGSTFHSLVCSCGGRACSQEVIGRKTKTACSAKCQAATGHTCECACGGLNHGAAHTEAVA